MKLGVALLLVVMAILVNRKLSQLVFSTRVSNTKETIIVIDAGHGGVDPGKVGVNGALEKDINLQIAKRIQEKLVQKKIKVVMTRERDESEENKLDDMKKRVDLINEIKPNIAVSIHQNSYTQGHVKGAQVFYYTDSEKSKSAALIMQEELKKIDLENTREVKANDTFFLLKKTQVPTIIVECGFLSNEEDAKKLIEEEYQEILADAICSGIIKWIEEKSGILE